MPRGVETQIRFLQYKFTNAFPDFYSSKFLQFLQFLAKDFYSGVLPQTNEINADDSDEWFQLLLKLRHTIRSLKRKAPSEIYKRVRGIYNVQT